MRSGSEIRETFLRFFEERGHQRVKSSSLIPKNDPTLLFTNAGMNQFKEIFLGSETCQYQRAVSSQKCMRVSGKHNDLETVGRTPRHHTFFEMLGNFSFGEYFKQEAIEFAWELCTEVFQLDPQRLIVTVYKDDDQAFQLWKHHIGIPTDRIFQCGEKDNFWAMGETGPCGPCSELHYDIGDRVGDTESPFGVESNRFVEIWNLVFMQFNRGESGRMTPLPSPSIDTGMGLERIACILQEVASNYDTDLFRPLVQEASRLTGVPYGNTEEKDVSLRILADHSRACAFLIDDGIVPGNEGRGYVLRKILRRAIRHAKMLGKDEPLLFTLTALVAEIMADAYPELLKSREYVAKVVKSEEEKFSATLSHGMGLLEDLMETARSKGSDLLPGRELFKLYDTYGFPLDLVREMAAETGFTVDESGFQAELEKQRQRARASWKGGQKQVKAIHRQLAAKGYSTEFTGYVELIDVEAGVLELLQNDRITERLAQGDEGELILDRTPFYAESGGQVSDQGLVENERCRAEVTTVYTPVTGLRLHRVRVLQGEIRRKDILRCSVDVDRRIRTAINHSATHLLQAALREMLGLHVKQAGSLVAPDRLRFDFTHFKPLSQREIREVEELVNEKIRENIPLRIEMCELDEALRRGAMALFGEKYDQEVRVVSVPGFSMELCGGTHVNSTGDIALFKIVQETSISAGVRRIEAVTAADALSRFLDFETLIQELSRSLHTPPSELPGAVERLAHELKEAGRQNENLRLQLAQQSTVGAGREARRIGDIQVLSQRVENVDRAGLRLLASQLKETLQSGVVVLGTPVNGKVNLVAMVTSDLVGRIRADDLIRKIAPLIQGGGGGKPEMAEAGGSKPEALEEALAAAYRVVEETLAEA